MLCIDPGHGGDAPCAKANGIVEGDYVLKLAKDLKNAVHGAGWPIPVALTRVSDRRMLLRERGQVSRQEAAGLVLSLHCNAWKADARGLMAFYWPGNALGRAVAMQIQRSAPVDLASRAAHPAYAATTAWPRVRNVLRFHKATAVLVEVGFITNPHDAKALRDKGVQRELVACLLGGIAHAATIQERQRPE